MPGLTMGASRDHYGWHAPLPRNARARPNLRSDALSLLLPAVPFNGGPGTCPLTLARPEGRRCQCAPPQVATAHSGFNPRPTRRPGAAGHDDRPSGDKRVVSILARPEGPALRHWSAMLRLYQTQFQSSPGPKARRCVMPHRRQHDPACFNPRPTRRPGAAMTVSDDPGGAIVSILARPEGRALRACLSSSVALSLFQSSPGPKAGRCL